MQITQIKLSQLKPADYNPRIMPEEEMKALQKSIAAFGFVEPFVVNGHNCEKCGDRKNVLIGGHQRLAALRIVIGEQDEEGTAPAVFVDLHIAQEKQLNIALNKITGQFDTPKLKHLLRGIQAKETKADLSLTGFTKSELANLLEPIELPEADAFAKVPDSDEPETQQMSFVLSRNQKVRVLEALTKIRDAGGLPVSLDEEESLGFSLVALAKNYNHGKQDNQPAD
jgi:ParB-like chromosome segregation protein Spo0J